MFTSFHETKMALLNERDLYAESRASRIDEMADDLYAEKLASLPNGRKNGTVYQSEAGYNIWSTIDDLDQADLIPVARAIVANDPAEVGRLMIKLVTAQLRKDAQQEADDYDEDHFNERKYGSV